MQSAQVVMESTAVARKAVNDYGLVYISGQGTLGEGPLDAVLPLAQKSLQRLATAVKAAGSEPDDVERITCFLSSLEQYRRRAQAGGVQLRASGPEFRAGAAGAHARRGGVRSGGAAALEYRHGRAHAEPGRSGRRRRSFPRSP